jgi:hypothetical protein
MVPFGNAASNVIQGAKLYQLRLGPVALGIIHGATLLCGIRPAGYPNFVVKTMA